MANKKVTLIKHVRTLQGWRRYPVVYGGNGRVRPGYVLVKGREEHNETGHFELRYYEGAKLKYQNVGTNAAEAQAACVQKTKVLGVRDTARAVGATLVEEEGRTSLTVALKAFITAAEDRGSMEAAKVYDVAATEFLIVTGKTYADEIVAEDFTKFHKALSRRGQAERTISNKHKLVLSFLKFAKVGADFLPKKAPRYDVTLPVVYSSEQLEAFFASLSSDYHRVVFTLLLQTGMREQEAMFLQWGDIDLRRQTLLVRSKPELGFRIKDREERSIPLGNGLVEMLTAYKASNPGRTFAIGTSGDLPNKKLLRTLKRAVHAAGLNCGVCTSCTERNECEVWFLHRFRSTFITTMLRSGLDLRSVMQLSGHSDIESVMRYLRPAEGEELRARVNSVRWGA